MEYPKLRSHKPTGSRVPTDTLQIVRVIAILAALAAFGWGLTSGSLASPRVPSLRLLGSSPITVRGIHFKARERVRVTLFATGALVARVRTSEAGAFTAQFGDNVAGGCSGLSIRAVGAGGDRALLKVEPLCPPP